VKVTVEQGFNKKLVSAEITLSCTVMHTSAIKERRQSLEAMVSTLGEDNMKQHWTNFEVMDDFHGQGCWWNAKRCWEYGLSTEATHHLLLQDDIVICKDFVTGVFEVVAAFPDKVISLYCNPRKGFAESQARWGESEGPWGPAIVMNKALIREFLAWEAVNVKPEFKHDDWRLTMFCVNTKQTVKVPFPNLIDHDDGLKSIMGNSWNKRRVSPDFMGERSPHDFNWQDKGALRKSVNAPNYDKKFLIHG
jgi:hypothetical protein